MKKIILPAIVIITAFLVISVIRAQQPAKKDTTQNQKDKSLKGTNYDALKRIADEEKEKQKANKEKALRLAKEKGWKIKDTLEDGTIIELIGVDEKTGMPLYYETHNAVAAITAGANTVHPGGILGLSLDGTGMTIGEWDGGGVRTTHVEFDAGRAIQSDVPSGLSSHSTHVAGTLIAKGVDATAKGMAPAATLNAYDWNSDNAEMATAAAGNLLISNHSYGFISGWNGVTRWYGDTALSATEDYKFGYYDYNSQVWDNISFNAPFYLIVKSAGNDRDDVGPAPGVAYEVFNSTTNTWVTSTTARPGDGGVDGYDCITGGSANAKNVLTVGAVSDIPAGYTSSADVVISNFSGYGPADDGRIKPDICGNGIGLNSCNSSADNTYFSSGGTSMSSPNVAGSLLLLQQHYQDLYGTPMRAATLKGLAIHTAYEAGASTGPDYQFGWGLINIKGAADVIANSSETNLITEQTLANGAAYTINLKAKGGIPLVATISWTDPAATPVAAVLDPSNKMLVNDLDLRITGTGTVLPYTLDPANPANAAVNSNDNNTDNVEKIFIAAPVAGEIYTINVTHKGALVNGPQAFSLIVSGSKAADLWAMDRPDDAGDEPNTISSYMWGSSDIWVRKQDDGIVTPVHENAEYRDPATGISNFVYVKVRNRGSEPSRGYEQLRLYWAKASSALSWTSPWIGGVYFDPGPNTMLMGNPIGNLVVPVIAPGGETVLTFSWFPPNPADYAASFGTGLSHFCLLARIETSPATGNGMTFIETNMLNDNVRNNNNIVWKNISVVDELVGANSENYVTVGNMTDEKTKSRFKFKPTDENGKETLLDRGKIKVNLGDKLFAKWKKNSKNAKGIETDEKNNLLITANNASIDNLEFEPNELHTIMIQYVPGEKAKNIKGYRINFTQLVVSEDGKETVLGGDVFAFGNVFSEGEHGDNRGRGWVNYIWWIILMLVTLFMVVWYVRRG